MVRADESTLNGSEPSLPSHREPTPAPARRSLYVAALLAAGLMLGRNGPTVDSHWWLFAAAVFALLALCTRGNTCRVALGLAVVAVGGGWFVLRAMERPHNDIAHHLAADQRLITVEGMIVETPRARTTRAGRFGSFLPVFEPSTSLRLDVDRLRVGDRSEIASGELLVFIGGDVQSLAAGHRISLTGMARAVEPASNPGEPDRLLWARATGQSGTMRVEGPALVEPATTEPTVRQSAFAAWRTSAAAVRARASAWATQEKSSPETGSGAALLRALFLGQRDESLRDVGDAFTHIGLAHVLAISGLHLTFLAWVMRQLVRTPGARPWTESLIVIVMIALYLLVIPVRAPAMRAAITAIGFLVADASGRRYDGLTILGWVFVVTLLWQPMELWSAGFQLSFGVVAALITLHHPLRAKLFGPPPSPDEIGWTRAAFERFKDACSASLCAWAVASPLVAFHMGIFSPFGAPITALFMPPIFVLLAVGYILMLISTVVPMISPWATPLIEAFADAIAWVATSIDALPGVALYLPMLSTPLTLALLAFVIWWITPMRFDAPLWRVRARLGLTLALAAWLALSLIFTGLPRSNAFRIDSVDVGDGSCHLIRSGRDAMLYDCGSLRLAMGEREIPAALRALGVWRIPTIVISHPNLDHYVGFPDIARRFGVRHALIGEGVMNAANLAPTGPVATMLERLDHAGVSVRVISAGESWMLGNASVEVLSPQKGARWKFDNDASLVLLVRAPVTPSDSLPDAHAVSERRLLLSGDIQRLGMAWTMERFPNLQADILEAPHHGSANPAAIDFVSDINPSIVIQSTGESRLNDPRWQEIRESHAWWATPAHGAISVIVHTDGSMHAFGWRNPPRSPFPMASKIDDP